MDRVDGVGRWVGLRARVRVCVRVLGRGHALFSRRCFWRACFACSLCLASQRIYWKRTAIKTTHVRLPTCKHLRYLLLFAGLAVPMPG